MLSPPPRSLANLRVGLVGSEELADGLGSTCSVQSLSPGGPLGAVHLVLVEGGERIDPRWERELPPMLEACEAAGIASVLWIATSPFDPAYLRCCSAFTRVFSADPGHLPALAAAGANLPAPLLAATALPVEDSPPGDTVRRSDPVVWLGGWREEWPEAWRARLSAVLTAAVPFGLRIAGPVDPQALPPNLRAHAKGGGNTGPDALRRARVAIGADATSDSPGLVPGVVFDAIACGAAVVCPHDANLPASYLALAPPGTPGTASGGGKLVRPVHDGASAREAIGELLGDDRRRETIVRDCRRIVALNHTLAHRIATIASVAGYRLIPRSKTPDPGRS